MSEKFNSKILILADELNCIFKDSNEQIKRMIDKKTRQRKLSYLDCINYKFINVQKYDTQKKLSMKLSITIKFYVTTVHFLEKNNKYHFNTIKIFMIKYFLFI